MFNRLDNSKTGGYTQSRKRRCDKRLASGISQRF
nr:MAG TPA: hypothetical protein [Siphoviridae sp. ctedi74]DAP42664.1 MAG TPA: hypothetical protein [Caudoviricetes sp.]DAQ15483.1 MAG TPA: hypothetical protein [Caudoviricetes sp.]